MPRDDLMDGSDPRIPVLHELYQQYLVDQDTAAFIHRVASRYATATLARLTEIGDRMIRRAAVLALGYQGDYDSNPVLGRALNDADRGVRLLAENAIRAVWGRSGSSAQRHWLSRVIALNHSHQPIAALREVTGLIREAPWLAEAWNQRAIAHFSLDRYAESIRDCRQALVINAYHFGAAAGMGQCFLKLNDPPAALQAFRRAVGLNPELLEVRAHVQFLERALSAIAKRSIARGRNAAARSFLRSDSAALVYGPVRRRRQPCSRSEPATFTSLL